jgi:N-methylhydantoinase B
MSRVDPVTFAVVREKLVSIANGMQETAARAGVTTFMYEVKDCLFAVLDAEAGVIAESHGLFLASLSPAVKNCLRYVGVENIRPGDVILSNIPEITGNHTSDVVVFAPIFFEGRIFGYAASKAHWIDLGAKNSYPTDSMNIHEEGLRIPPLKLYRDGRLQSEIWDIIRCSSRMPDLVWGDMQSQIAGCRYAERPVLELLSRYGSEAVNAIIGKCKINYTERITRMEIDTIPEEPGRPRTLLTAADDDRDHSNPGDSDGHSSDMTVDSPAPLPSKKVP